MTPYPTIRTMLEELEAFVFQQRKDHPELETVREKLIEVREALRVAEKDQQ